VGGIDALVTRGGNLEGMVSYERVINRTVRTMLRRASMTTFFPTTLTAPRVLMLASTNTIRKISISSNGIDCRPLQERADAQRQTSRLPPPVTLGSLSTVKMLTCSNQSETSSKKLVTSSVTLRYAQISTRGIKARASYLGDAAETWTTKSVNNAVKNITNASGCMSTGDLNGEMMPVLSTGKEQKGEKRFGKKKEGKGTSDEIKQGIKGNLGMIMSVESAVLYGSSILTYCTSGDHTLAGIIPESSKLKRSFGTSMTFMIITYPSIGIVVKSGTCPPIQ
jgi:hypothetical protein